MNYIINDLMMRAICLAKKAGSDTLPNPRVGAVIFDDKGCVLGEGYHHSFGSIHAEIEAIKDARSKGHDVHSKNICVTLEPCNHHGKTPPCTDAILDAGIKKVFIGTSDDCQTVCGDGIQQLLSKGVAVSTGILEQECRDLNPGFHKYNLKGLPFIRIKLAVSINGVMGSTWFTGELAKKRVYELRSFSDLLITGLGTIKKDDPKFSLCRVVILDENMELYDLYRDRSLNVFKFAKEVIVVTGSERSLSGVRVIRAELAKDGLIDIRKLIPKLCNELSVREIMVEAGPRLTNSFIKDAVDMIDKFNIFVAPIELDEDNKMPKMPNIVIEKEENLENVLALEGHFDI